MKSLVLILGLVSVGRASTIVQGGEIGFRLSDNLVEINWSQVDDGFVGVWENVETPNPNESTHDAFLVPLEQWDGYVKEDWEIPTSLPKIPGREAPEPRVWFLVGIGLMGIGVIRLKRKEG